MVDLQKRNQVQWSSYWKTIYMLELEWKSVGPGFKQSTLILSEHTILESYRR